MITNCYIKGRFDYGVGKCAVVIVDDAKPKDEQTIAHQAAWKVPERWEYEGTVIMADQYNCEILAAVYALQWCLANGKGLVNLYANTTTCQKWYMRGEFPDERAMGDAWRDVYGKYTEHLTEEAGETVRDWFFAEYMAKKEDNEFNRLVNELAEKVK